MIETIATIVTTGIVVGTTIGLILNGFYKTNKEATKDYEHLEEKFREEIRLLEKRLEHEFNNKNDNIKEELEKISEKIDHIKTRYVTHDNFKTYADSIAQLLQLSTDRMTRIETTLDDIRDDITSIIRQQNINH